jgi:hypothetical protein
MEHGCARMKDETCDPCCVFRLPVYVFTCVLGGVCHFNQEALQSSHI